METKKIPCQKTGSETIVKRNFFREKANDTRKKLGTLRMKSNKKEHAEKQMK